MPFDLDEKSEQLSEIRFQNLTGNNKLWVQIGDILLTPNMTAREVVSMFADSKMFFSDICFDRWGNRGNYEEDGNLGRLSLGTIWNGLEVFSTAKKADSSCCVTLYNEDSYIEIKFGGLLNESMKYGDMIIYELYVDDLSKIEVRYMNNLFGNHFDNGALIFTSRHNWLSCPSENEKEKNYNEIPGDWRFVYDGESWESKLEIWGITYFDSSDELHLLYYKPMETEWEASHQCYYLKKMKFYFETPIDIYDAFDFSHKLIEM